jgi:cobalt-zinc-cadmium efflux system protein
MNQCHHSIDPTSQSIGKAFAIAVIANLLFTILEVAFALNAHSSSLLADAGHNFGDVFGLSLAWFAHWLLSRKPKAKFSYGYKRATIVSAFVNAVILIVTSILIAIHSIDALRHPEHVTEGVVMIVALIGVFVNAGTAMLFIRNQKDLNVKGAFLHLAFDALISFGVVVAAIIIYYTHWYWLDPVVGLCVVAIILWGTWSLFRKSLDLMLDAVPHEIDHRDVKTFLLSWPGITDIHDLHIWALSTSEVALTAHMVLPDRYLDDGEFGEINCQLLKKFGIKHTTLQMEKGTVKDIDSCCGGC